VNPLCLFHQETKPFRAEQGAGFFGLSEIVHLNSH
jgi:hypothetical protein